MAQKTIATHTDPRLRTVLLGAYASLLLVYLGSSFLTHERLWGISIWGYLPVWVRGVLFVAGLLAIPVALRFSRPTTAIPKPAKPSVAAAVSFVLVPACGLCFWFFRGTTHFLGNGYSHLESLSGGTPIIKWHEPGESLLHLWVAQILGGNNPDHVLLSFQILSVLAGILFVTLVVWTAGKLFGSVLDRILFSLGLATAGNVILFFGYVENRSLLAVCIGAFTCLGLLAAEGKLKRWVTLFPLALAIFMHIFGVILIPAALYLLVAGTRFERKLVNLSNPSKLGLVLVCGLVAALGLWIGLSRSMFFEISLMHPFANRLTVAGYTMFSGAHLMDFVNLILLLFPAVVLALVLFAHSQSRPTWSHARYRFLIILVLSALGAAFIFDPKLGMPRDWDLFAFPAIPLATLGYILFLDGRLRASAGRLAAILAVTLGILTVCPRVTTLLVPVQAVAQVRDYYDLDKLKSKSALLYLQQYFKSAGETARADSAGKEFGMLPDEQLFRQITASFRLHNYPQAIQLANKATAINPMSWQAYQSAGWAHTN